jgi:hypothetical protein
MCEHGQSFSVKGNQDGQRYGNECKLSFYQGNHAIFSAFVQNLFFRQEEMGTFIKFKKLFKYLNIRDEFSSNKNPCFKFYF